jgi:hypothetical protein
VVSTCNYPFGFALCLQRLVLAADITWVFPFGRFAAETEGFALCLQRLVFPADSTWVYPFGRFAAETEGFALCLQRLVFDVVSTCERPFGRFAAETKGFALCLQRLVFAVDSTLQVRVRPLRGRDKLLRALLLQLDAFGRRSKVGRIVPEVTSGVLVTHRYRTDQSDMPSIRSSIAY